MIHFNLVIISSLMKISVNKYKKSTEINFDENINPINFS